MTTVTTSSAAGFNRGKQNCYTESTDQFGKTVFTSPGQGVIVEYTELSTPTGSNVTITNNGTISLDANITYEISHRVSTVPSVFDDPGQGHVLFNTTAQQVLWPVALMGETNTILFTPDVNTNLILLAFMPDGTPPNTLTQPKTWQYPQQIQNCQISIVQVGGETA
jgi:hypothetical protein